MDIKDIKLYDIEMNWKDVPNGIKIKKTVAVGFCPFEKWGDDMDKWTSDQTRFDESIFYFFENIEELKEHTVNDDKGEFLIKSYEPNGKPFDPSTI